MKRCGSLAYPPCPRRRRSGQSYRSPVRTRWTSQYKDALAAFGPYRSPPLSLIRCSEKTGFQILFLFRFSSGSRLPEAPVHQDAGSV